MFPERQLETKSKFTFQDMLDTRIESQNMSHNLHTELRLVTQLRRKP